MKKAKKRPKRLGSRVLEKSRAPTADELAEMAMRGEDVTKFYDLKSMKLHPGHGKLKRVLSNKNLQNAHVYSDDEIRGWVKADQFKDENERLKVRAQLKRARKKPSK